LQKSNYLAEFATDAEKQQARANLGLENIDGGTFTSGGG
jgi:hypothetical protein